LSFDKWPYGKKRTIVLSNNEIKIPLELKKTVSWSALNPYDLIQKLSKEGIRSIYVDGGNTIQRFLLCDMLDEMTITIIPILLGKGKRLFSEVTKEIRLELISSKAYDFGFVQNRYKVCKEKIITPAEKKAKQLQEGT
jgi:dihydrofolate reductase